MKITIPEITIAIPRLTALARYWKAGLLAVLVIALALTLTLRGDGARRAEATWGNVQININVVDSVYQTNKLADTCWIISIPPVTEKQIVDIVSDNNAKPADCDNLLTPLEDLSDKDTANKGSIRITLSKTVLKTFGFVWYVDQLQAPDGYNVDDTQYTCTFSGSEGEKCELTIKNVSKATQINIEKWSTQILLPDSCFEVRNQANTTKLFQVCDNDFQAGFPQSNTVCIPDGVCDDEDTRDGYIRVSVVPGNYNVVESKAPVSHNLNTTKKACNAKTAKCDLTFKNDSKWRPWFPWDVTGPAGVPDGTVDLMYDVFDVADHFDETKPLP